MGLVMIVTFYTSRVILDVLGVSDYGIYNIVGSVVVLFNFVNNILTIAIRRFISTELVTDFHERVVIIFKASVRAVSVLAVLLFILLETAGLWFLNYKLNIPIERMSAANWCFQFSILTFILNLLSVPYNAAIVSYEKMGVYAYFGIIDVVLRLAVVLSLERFHTYDLLIAYSFMICLEANFIRYLNVRYCSKHVIPSTVNIDVDNSIIKEIFSYSSWAMCGAIVGMVATQGVNILLNLFYGVDVNAALGISQQVSGAVLQFGSNFQTAFNPQLTKSFAAYGMNDETQRFCIRMTKLSIILILTLCLPLILNMDNVLSIWLVNVPNYTKELCIIYLIYVAFEVLSMPLYVLIYAKGEIKKYSVLLSLIQLIYVLCIYITCKMGLSPVQVVSLNIMNALLLFIGRLYMMNRLMNFNIIAYFRRILFPLVIPLIITFLSWKYVIYNLINEDLVGTILSVVAIVVIFLISTLLTYLNKEEKLYALNLLKIRRHENN